MSENRSQKRFGIRCVWRKVSLNDAGSTAVEFGIIASLIAIISAAVVDLSLLLFDYARAAEATRAATRLAVILPPVGNLNDLESADVVCNSSGGATSCTGGTLLDETSFNSLVERMRKTLPDIEADNVEVEYRASGVGTAMSGGYKPYVTVRLKSLQHDLFFLGNILGGATGLSYPSFATTLLGNPYEPV